MDLNLPPQLPDHYRTGLSPKRLAFLDAWFGNARFNASEAARIAGYRKPGMAGWRLMQNVEVRAEIARRTQEAVIDREEILSRLRQQVTTGLTALKDCFKDQRGERGLVRRVLDMDKVHKLGLGHLIRKVTPTKYGDSVEMYDAQEALIRLGQTMGLFAEKHIHSTDLSDLENKSLEELRELDERINGKPKKLGSR